MNKPADGADYCTRIVGDLATIGQAAWNALVAASGRGNPFIRYEFLHALHATGCATLRSGWEPQYLTLWRGDQLAGAVPLYRKHHSYGEYVFDWAWASAYQQHGIEYYPKWLAAVPFTPVPGARLIARDSSARDLLARALISHARESALSSLHVLFAPHDEIERLAEVGMLTRQAVQFHWLNEAYSSFGDYLAALSQPKRKKIRAERRTVTNAGVTFERKVGNDITESDWNFFMRCYATTYAAHYSTPYLNRRFFLQTAQSMPEALLMVVARREQQPIAAALALFDCERLYGRYWGAIEFVPCLHFEASYYQMIEFAIERKLKVFEGGAQGEHKLARGFEPVTTYSSHWLAHPAFADAVERYLQRETGGIEAYVDELNERSALRKHPSPE
ncbi:MAG TPA: GNAT family N-acetyltransferase [Burkholderiaceae bacterium]|nr:GNAT family N-acetyltransferase [Burkholderiaceae bacterium]